MKYPIESCAKTAMIAVLSLLVCSITYTSAKAQTMPFQKKWYQLELALDSSTVIAHAEHAGCSEIQREAKKAGDLTQMWAFLPAGNDYYYVCTRSNGLCITYKDAPAGNLLTLKGPTSKLSDKQKVRLIPKGKNSYQIRFKSGDYLHNSRDLTSCSAKHAIKHRTQHENQRQTVTLKPAADIKVPNTVARNKPGEIPLPPSPQGAEKTSPPSQTSPVLIGQTALPYLVVTDPLYKTNQDKIRDRVVYYKVQREQNWLLKKYKNYDPGKYTFGWESTNGISTQTSKEMETRTTIKVMADMNVKYKNIALDLKNEFARSLQVKESSTTKEISETKECYKYKVTAERPFSIAQWQLQDIYTIYRVDNKKATRIDSWTIGDARYTPHTTYPESGVTVSKTAQLESDSGC